MSRINHPIITCTINYQESIVLHRTLLSDSCAVCLALIGNQYALTLLEREIADSPIGQSMCPSIEYRVTPLTCEHGGQIALVAIAGRIEAN